jgi:hypothetical protein
MMKRPLFAFLANTAMARGAAPGSGLGSTSRNCPFPACRSSRRNARCRRFAGSPNCSRHEGESWSGG